MSWPYLGQDGNWSLTYYHKPHVCTVYFINLIFL